MELSLLRVGPPLACHYPDAQEARGIGRVTCYKIDRCECAYACVPRPVQVLSGLAVRGGVSLDIDKDPYSPWLSTQVGSNQLSYALDLLLSSVGSISVSEISAAPPSISEHFRQSICKMSDTNEDVMKGADKALSFIDILAAINASRLSSESLALAQEERMYRHVAASREEVLTLVSNDIDSVANDLRVESEEMGAKIRAENQEKHELVRRDVDAVSIAAAGAVAQVEDIRCEMAQKHGDIVAAVRREEVEPLRLELREALAVNEANF